MLLTCSLRDFRYALLWWFQGNAGNCRVYTIKSWIVAEVGVSFLIKRVTSEDDKANIPAYTLGLLRVNKGS